MLSMLKLITPAMPMAIITSIVSKRKILFFSSSVLPTTRRWVKAECR
jgi:hypothetical protein